MYQFAWAAVDNAVQYHIEVALDPSFRSIVDEAWVQGTSAQVQSMDLENLEPGTYYWRVSAMDAAGYESAWSEMRHFVYPMELN